jgi:[ribosomal protein S18]-alanine N-acetyltransferase
VRDSAPLVSFHSRQRQYVGMSDELIIRRYETEIEARAAAESMAGTDPWITLGRNAEQTYRNVTLPQQESYVGIIDGKVVGVVIVALPIPLIKGYISGLAVKQEYRNRGIGAKLMNAAEERIFRESPNVFLCVSSFNRDAKRFYERIGYHVVGELTEFAISDHHEILMRKTIGPWSGFVPVPQSS